MHSRAMPNECYHIDSMIRSSYHTDSMISNSYNICTVALSTSDTTMQITHAKWALQQHTVHIWQQITIIIAYTIIMTSHCTKCRWYIQLRHLYKPPWRYMQIYTPLTYNSQNRSHTILKVHSLLIVIHKQRREYTCMLELTKRLSNTTYKLHFQFKIQICSRARARNDDWVTS